MGGDDALEEDLLAGPVDRAVGKEPGSDDILLRLFEIRVGPVGLRPEVVIAIAHGPDEHALSILVGNVRTPFSIRDHVCKLRELGPFLVGVRTEVGFYFGADPWGTAGTIQHKEFLFAVRGAL